MDETLFERETNWPGKTLFSQKMLDTKCENKYITSSSLWDLVSHWPRVACAPGILFLQGGLP